MILFSEEEEKYLKYPPKGRPVCYEKQTPPEILKVLKRKNNSYLEMVGCDFIIFKR